MDFFKTNVVDFCLDTFRRLVNPQYTIVLLRAPTKDWVFRVDETANEYCEVDLLQITDEHLKDHELTDYIEMNYGITISHFQLQWVARMQDSVYTTVIVSILDEQFTDLSRDESLELVVGPIHSNSNGELLCNGTIIKCLNDLRHTIQTIVVGTTQNDGV
jgi:hypothetical protein